MIYVGHILPQAKAKPIKFWAKLDLVAQLIVQQLLQTQLKFILKEIYYRRYKISQKQNVKSHEQVCSNLQKKRRKKQWQSNLSG